jgi:hypothetical protein
MPSVKRFKEFYQGYRFVAVQDGLDGGKKLITLSALFQDLFNDAVILCRGHAVGQPTFNEALGMAGCITAYLFTRDPMHTPIRSIDIRWNRAKHCPVDFNGAQDDVALEWLILKEATVSSPQDVEFEELPSEVQQVLGGSK